MTLVEPRRIEYSMENLSLPESMQLHNKTKALEQP